MTHITCRLTAKNRDQLRNLTLSDRVWATFTFIFVMECYTSAARRPAPVRTKCIRIVSTQRTIEVYETSHYQQQHHTHVATGVHVPVSVADVNSTRCTIFPALSRRTEHYRSTAWNASALRVTIRAGHCKQKHRAVFSRFTSTFGKFNLPFYDESKLPSCTQSSARC